MTILSVAVNDPVDAPKTNQLIDHVNASPGRAIFTSNGVWAVPSGVHKFRVYLAAGGGGAEPDTTGGGGDTFFTIPGGPGFDAHLASCDFAGVDIGTSFAITIGAGGGISGGTGGSTSFGASFSATGAVGYTNKGTVTFPSGALAPMYHSVMRYLNSSGQGYGQGGAGSGAAGRPGIVVIEW